MTTLECISVVASTTLGSRDEFVSRSRPKSTLFPYPMDSQEKVVSSSDERYLDTRGPKTCIYFTTWHHVWYVELNQATQGQRRAERYPKSSQRSLNANVYVCESSQGSPLRPSFCPCSITPKTNVKPTVLYCQTIEELFAQCDYLDGVAEPYCNPAFA